jgi:hypothetical protein
MPMPRPQPSNVQLFDVIGSDESPLVADRITSPVSFRDAWCLSKTLALDQRYLLLRLTTFVAFFALFFAAFFATTLGSSSFGAPLGNTITRLPSNAIAIC